MCSIISARGAPASSLSSRTLTRTASAPLRASGPGSAAARVREARFWKVLDGVMPDPCIPETEKERSTLDFPQVRKGGFLPAYSIYGIIAGLL